MLTKMCSNRRIPSRTKISAKILKKLKSAFKYCRRPVQSENVQAIANATDEQKLWNQDQSIYPSYEEIIVTDSRESIQQSLSTVDSGVNLSKDHTTPFTVTVEAVVEAKPFYPHCCSTPNSLNTEYKAELGNGKETLTDGQVNYSTYTKNKSATLERAIQNVNVILNNDPDIIQLDASYENYQSRKTKDETDDKFVVNLFESRPSKRWQRRCLSPKLFQKEAIEFDRNNICRCSRKIQQQNRSSTYSQLSKSDEMYLQLKKIRDAECVKMNQASNALLAIKMKANREWREELVAEKILLECDIRNKLIIKKIRELKCAEEYSQIYKKRVPHKGSITISNFEFDLKLQDKPKNNRFTDFYVMALSHGTTLNMSKITTVNEENKIVFNDKFTLDRVEDNFSVNVEVFTLRLRTKKENFCEYLFKKKTNNCCMSKIYYEDVNLNELLQSEILTPSFTPCVNFTLTKNQIGNSALFISPPTESKFKNYVNVNVSVNSFDLGTDVSGFLSWGTKKDSVIIWERKWVSLKGSRLSVYNYPQEEEYDKDPCQNINLEYCLIPLVKEIKSCPRRRTFVIKTGRPSTFRDHDVISLRKRQNFVLEKFYVSADNNEDFKKWTGSLESTLDTMRDWRRLVFIDDYYIQ